MQHYKHAKIPTVAWGPRVVAIVAQCPVANAKLKHSVWYAVCTSMSPMETLIEKGKTREEIKPLC